MKQGLDIWERRCYNIHMKSNKQNSVPSLKDLYNQSIQDAQTGKISWDQIPQILAQEVKNHLSVNDSQASKIVCDNMLEMDLWE